MEPKGSLPHSQEPATCPNPEPHRYNSRPLTPWKTKFRYKFDKSRANTRGNQDSVGNLLHVLKILNQFLGYPAPIFDREIFKLIENVCDLS